MLEVERAADLAAHVGQVAGTSEWMAVDQARIDAFAAATGDHQWIHVDTERASRELPGGRTIAHGFLTLSLLPELSRQVWSVRQRSRALNYGANRVRFTAPVPSGARIRLRQVVRGVEPVAGGARIIMESTVEIEGQERPALVAETITLVYD